jgi:hypothetical protein
MIKFFRKIRQDLLSKGKTGKYLKYAFGEIVLVVIGILIALQINSWNEFNKERESEKRILTEIRDNLVFDLVDFESNITTFQNKITSSKSLLKILESNSEYNDSIGFFFYYLKTYPHFSNKSNGYNLLRSKGLDIIQNDSIRKRISDLYEDRYQYLKTYEKERIDYNNSLENKISPYYGIRTLSKDIKPKEIIVKGSTNTLLEFGFFRNIRNYDLLKKDIELHGIIKDIETWSTILGAIHNKVRNDVLTLIKQIETELNLIS